MSLATPPAGDRLDRLDELGYCIYRRLVGPDGDVAAEVERKLTQAAIAEPVEMYFARALAVAFLVAICCGTLAFSGAALLGTWPTEPTALAGRALGTAAIGALAGLVGASLTVGVFLGRPYLLAGRREREIDVLLPDAVSYMYALSTGGLNEVEIVEAMAEADDTYGEVAREFQRVVREMTYFDMDYRTAIREQAIATPSDDLGEFLTDLLSIVNSGGDLVDFLDDQKSKYMRTAKHTQEATLETLELLGELYIALSLFPLLLIIVLVIMGIMGTSQLGLLYATVYGLIPIGNLGFLVLVSMVKRDDPGDGYIKTAGSAYGVDPARPGPGDLAASVSPGTPLYDRIARRERAHELLQQVRRPHTTFKRNPTHVLLVTVPLTVATLAYGVLAGDVPTSWAALSRRPVAGTVFYLYLPLYLNVLPLASFYEWNRRSRRPITGKLSDSLRKLSSANDTGLSLLESMETVAETSSGELADELSAVCSKVRYGTSMRDALVEFNNAYHVPRLARTVKLIAKAQEASSQITSVLTTAAQASETQDDLERQRRSRTRLQVVIIVMTYLTMLAVMVVLKTQFLNVMSEVMASTGEPIGVGSSLGRGVGESSLSLLLFHAVSIQAVLSGFIAGYIREGDLLAGLKFVVALTAVALTVWVVMA